MLVCWAVGCLNNDHTVISCPYAWRPLALLPILKPTAFNNNDVEWQRYRRLSLYHSCMDYVVDEINELCSEDQYFRFADGRVRLGRCFGHLLSMDGLEIAANQLFFFRQQNSLFRQLRLLFRQVGSLFRQVGSLFRQSLRSQVSGSLLESRPSDRTASFCLRKLKLLSLSAQLERNAW